MQPTGWRIERRLSATWHLLAKRQRERFPRSENALLCFKTPRNQIIWYHAMAEKPNSPSAEQIELQNFRFSVFLIL
jgi:hypothetical protein